MAAITSTMLLNAAAAVAAAVTVPLNYNFILTRMSMSGATKYFACQMPEFPVEICILTRRDMAFRRGIYTRCGTWHLHVMES